MSASLPQTLNGSDQADTEERRVDLLSAALDDVLTQALEATFPASDPVSTLRVTPPSATRVREIDP